MSNSEINKKIVFNGTKVGVLYYANQLILEAKIECNHYEIYNLFVWLETENKQNIENHYIKEKTSITIPKEDVDLIKILFIRVSNFCKKIDKKVATDYCIKYENKCLYQSKKKPGKNEYEQEADDMIYGDECDEKMLSYHPYFKYTITEAEKIISKDYLSINPNALISVKRKESLIFWSMRELLLDCSFFNSSFKDELMNLFDNFISGNGVDYNSERFSKEIETAKETKLYVNEIKKIFVERLKDKHFDIAEFRDNEIFSSVQDNMKHPKYGMKYILSGLMIAVHDTHGNRIEIRNAYIKNGVFYCSLCFDIYDHFGLDWKDIEKFGGVSGFRAWYYLQHSKKYQGKYKPFVTHARFEIKIEENIQ